MNVRKDFLIVGSGLIPNSVDMDGGNENIGLVSKKKRITDQKYFLGRGGGCPSPLFINPSGGKTSKQ